MVVSHHEWWPCYEGWHQKSLENSGKEGNINGGIWMNNQGWHPERRWSGKQSTNAMRNAVVVGCNL